MAVAGCGVPPPLEEVEPPPDLEQLDRTVQEQFQELWRALPSGRAEAWGPLGQWYDVYGYPDSAERCYENARRLDTGEGRWPYYIGVLRERAGELSTAESLYAEAARLAPDVTSPLVRLGDLALARNDLDTAQGFYERVSSREPDNLAALLGRGRVALAVGDASRAVQLLEQVVAQQSDITAAHYALSLAWRRLGDSERVAAELALVPEDSLDQTGITPGGAWDREVLMLDRGARRLTRQGIRASRRGERGRAAVLLGAAVAADPEGAEKRINYAVALRALGHYPEAVEQLRQALELATSDPGLATMAHVELGRLAVDSGRPDHAAREFEAALSIDEGSVAAHIELGKLLQGQGLLDQALAHYAAVEGDPRGGRSASFWLAALLAAQGQSAPALAALARAEQTLGRDRELHLLRARLMATDPGANTRDVELARALIEEGTEPKDVLYAESRAMAAAAAGQFGEAASWERAALAALDEHGVRPQAQIARRRLVLYERRDTCRAPWERTERLVLLPVTPPGPER
jgi:tetratricopeptide (TPR) repeat protein